MLHLLGIGSDTIVILKSFCVYFLFTIFCLIYPQISDMFDFDSPLLFLLSNSSLRCSTSRSSFLSVFVILPFSPILFVGFGFLSYIHQKKLYRSWNIRESYFFLKIKWLRKRSTWGGSSFLAQDIIVSFWDVWVIRNCFFACCNFLVTHFWYSA